MSHWPRSLASSYWLQAACKLAILIIIPTGAGNIAPATEVVTIQEVTGMDMVPATAAATMSIAPDTGITTGPAMVAAAEAMVPLMEEHISVCPACTSILADIAIGSRDRQNLGPPGVPVGLHE